MGRQLLRKPLTLLLPHSHFLSLFCTVEIGLGTQSKDYIRITDIVFPETPYFTYCSPVEKLSLRQGRNCGFFFFNVG